MSELQIRGDIEDNSKILFCYFSRKTYVVNPLKKTVLMMDRKICFYGEMWLIIPKLSYLEYIVSLT